MAEDLAGGAGVVEPGVAGVGGVAGAGGEVVAVGKVPAVCGGRVCVSFGCFGEGG